MFLGYERVLARTLEIAERCNVRLEKVHDPFPQFEVPSGYSIPDYFEHVTREGFARRVKVLRELQTMGRLKHSIEDYERRLATEIAIIRQMQFPGYFLIVWDFIRYARGASTFRLGPAVDRRQVRWWPTRYRLRTSTRCRTSCCSSAS